jgi:hypothetical protein
MKKITLGMLVHTINPSTQEPGTERWYSQASLATFSKKRGKKNYVTISS